MNQEEREEYERLLEQGRRYQETGDPRVFTRRYRLAKLTRCPVCFTCLTDDGFCYPCAEYRTQV